MYLGDYKEDDSLFFAWSTNDKDGASITRATDGTISVYRNAADAQSTAGITDAEDFDGLTGIHMCTIDLSSDSFYSVQGDYSVVLSAATIDGETVNAVLATFSIENRIAGGRGLASQARIDALGFVSGIVDDSGALVSSFISDLTEVTDDHFNDLVIIFTTGVLLGQARRISDYNGTTKVISVTPDLTDAPDFNDTFVIASASFLQVIAESLGTQAKADVNAEVDTALIDLGLDHLLSASVAGADVADNSIFARMVSSAGTADWDTFVNTTDSLQAIRDRGDAAWITAVPPTAAAIADAVWDEARAGHVAAGSFGAGVLVEDVNAAGLASINAEVDTALVDIGLDHLVFAAVVGADITDNSIIARMVSSAATADWDTFVNTTDSLQAIRDRGDTAWTTAAAGPTAAAIADAVWDEARAGHVAGGSFGEGVASVQGSVTGSVASVTGAVGSVAGNVDGNVTGSVGSLAAQAKLDVNAEVDTALSDIGLDHLLSAAVVGADVTDDSVFARLVSSAATADWDTFVNTTDSLQAIRDRGDVAWITAAAGPTAAAIADAVWDEAKADHTGATTFGDLGNKIDQVLSTTESNIRGADSDDLKTISDQVDGIQTTVDGISNVTRLSCALPKFMQRPPAGNTAVLVRIALKDLDGNMEDPDLNDLALKVYNSADVSRNAQLFKDQALTTVLDNSLYPSYKKTERVSVGVYEFYYKVESVATEEELTLEFTWVELSTPLIEFKSTQILDATNDINAIKAKTDLLDFTGVGGRLVADSEAISNSVAAADSVEANIGNLDAAITTRATPAQVNTEVDTALVDIGLDHLLSTSVAGADVTDNSIFARLASKAATADWDTFVNTDDSLEAIRDRGDAAWTSAAAGPSAADIADAVWDELRSGHVIAGSFGQGVASVQGSVTGSVASVTGAVGSVAGNVDGNVTGSIGSLAAQAKLDVNAEVDTALVDIGLDHLISAAVAGADVTDDSIIAQLVSKAATADWDTFVNTTDSLEAIRDRGDVAWITAAAGPTAAVIADAVWDEARAGHVAAGSFGEGVASVQGSVTGSVASVTGAVGSVTGAVGSVAGNVDGNVTGSIGSLAAQAKLDVNAEVDTALTDIGLDHLLSAAVVGADVTDNSIFARLASSAATADWDTFVNTTESLQAIRDRGDVAWITAIPPTVGAIADAVWDEVLAGHLTAGTTGKALDDAKDAADAATIADAVWDEAMSGHTTLGTFGQSLQKISFGTAQAGAIGSITLAASSSALDDFFNNGLICITAGVGVGQARRILDYDGTTKVVTVANNWVTAPDDTTEYLIIPQAEVQADVTQTDIDNIVAAVFSETGITSSGTRTFRQLVNILFAIASGRWLRRSATSNLYDIFDEDGSTLLLTLQQLSATEYRTIFP